MAIVSAESAFDQAMGVAVLPDHVSFSQLDLMIKCPEAYRQRYLVGTRGAATSPLVVGSGVHAGIAELYEQLRANPKLSKKTLVASAISAAEAEIEKRTEHGTLFGEEAEQTRHLIEVYAAERPTHVKPVAAEKRIEIRLPDSDIPLIGYVDLEAEAQLVEIKTSGRKVTVPTGAWKVQAWLYQAAIPKLVEFHVLVKHRQPLLITSAALAVPYDARVTQKAIGLASATLERIQRLYHERGAEEEWPTDGILHPWACNTCDARSACPIRGGYSWDF